MIQQKKLGIFFLVIFIVNNVDLVKSHCAYGEILVSPAEVINQRYVKNAPQEHTMQKWMQQLVNHVK